MKIMVESNTDNLLERCKSLITNTIIVLLFALKLSFLVIPLNCHNIEVNYIWH